MKNISFFADDFCYDRKSADYVKKLTNKLSLISILVNFKELIPSNLLIKNKFALHLNFIEGKPVSDDLRTLINRRGHFYSFPILFVRLLFRLIDYKEIEKEAESQIKRFLKTGRKLYELNSHQHLHALYPFSEITIKLAKKYSIKNIRSYRDVACFTVKAKITYFFLAVSALLSSFAGRLKIAFPRTWFLKRNGSDVYMSWESDYFDFSKLRNRKKINFIIHPGLPFDSNKSFYKILI